MTKIVEVIDNAVRSARDADRRRREERSVVKEAEAQPRTDLAQDLRMLASILRQDSDNHA